MKNKLNSILSIIACITFVACNEGQSRELQKTANIEQDHTAHQPQQVMPASQQKLLIKDDYLNAVYDQYKQLTTSLINGDVAKVKIASNALEAGATQMKGGNEIATAASKITSASELEAQRKHYASLSNALIQLIKNAGVENGELYLDYCPMALNDKGAYWLSSEKEIRNPYFGNEMLTCGEIKETIKN